MSVFLTIFSGVCVYVVGQLLVKLLIDPVQQLRVTIGRIAYALHEYGNIYTQGPGREQDEERAAKRKEAFAELRHLSSQLLGDVHVVPCYPRISRIFRLPSEAQISEAKGWLLFLHNGGGTDDATAAVDAKSKIREALGFRGDF